MLRRAMHNNCKEELKSTMRYAPKMQAKHTGNSKKAQIARAPEGGTPR